VERNLKSLLEVRGLSTYFFMKRGVLKAVDGVTFNIEKGQTLGLVGETGSGKSVTALSVTRLIQYPGRIVSGEVILQGENLLKKSDEEMRKVRGKNVSMIFQDPSTALNPVFTIGDQLIEAINVHKKVSGSEAKADAVKMLQLVGVPLPEKRLDNYPHEFSGGMKQRVMIAMALSCNPMLLIADEATTNLDVTVQAQVLDLMRGLKKSLETSILLITHDMGVVAEMSDMVGVMYAGELVELGKLDEIFYNSYHPYTKGLLECVSRLKGTGQLKTIPGAPPDMLNPPSGCKFHPRCTFGSSECASQKHSLTEVAPNHFAACEALQS